MYTSPLPSSTRPFSAFDIGGSSFICGTFGADILPLVNFFGGVLIPSDGSSLILGLGEDLGDLPLSTGRALLRTLGDDLGELPASELGFETPATAILVPTGNLRIAEGE